MKCSKHFLNWLDEAEDKCDPPVLPRQRLPWRLNDGGDGHSFCLVHEF